LRQSTTPKSHLDQFATVSHITKAENINQSVYRPQATLQKPGTSINQFADRRPLHESLETSIRRIRIRKTTIQQSEIRNSILHTLVPTTIYFLSHTHSFNSICSIYSILQDELRDNVEEATGRHPYIQELEEVVSAYRAVLRWRRIGLCLTPDREGILWYPRIKPGKTKAISESLCKSPLYNIDLYRLSGQRSDQQICYGQREIGPVAYEIQQGPTASKPRGYRKDSFIQAF
jgi:hypothetical protein